MPTQFRTFWQKILRFFGPVRMSRKVFIVAACQSTLWSLVSVAFVQITKQVTAALEAGDRATLMQNFYIFLAVALVGYICVVAFHVYYDLIRFELQKNLLSLYLNKSVKLDNNRYESIGTGYLNSIINRGVYTWSELLRTVFDEGIDAFWQVMMSFVLIYLTGGIYYLLIAVGVFVIMMTVMIVGAWWSRQRRIKKREMYGASDAHLVRMLMTKFEMLLNGKVAQEVAKMREYFEKIKAYHYQDRKGLLISFTAPRALWSVMRGAIYLYVGVGVLEGRYSIADFVLLITVLDVLRIGVLKIITTYREFVHDFMYVERLWDRFDAIPCLEGYEKGNQFIFKQGDIVLDNISFQYPEPPEDYAQRDEEVCNLEYGCTIFENLSLQISGGSKTAFVGVSGCGKSTLIKLIAGYLRPDNGKVLVDGQDLKKVSLKSYYEHIGYLTQEPSVFDGTLWENLTYAVDLPLDELKHRVKEAITLSKCEFIYELPHGIQTEVGERGIKLSGGQRQRVAIAKIFIKNPAILLLDEPTSALDSFSENSINAAMVNLYTGRTVIIIAHRLQTVKDADDIIVLEEGNIVERGTHAELAEEGKTYKKMIDLQGGF